ncbi:SR-related and CTD-associated factor 8 isoform X2 [Corythoichthys intestinalis]|nr:SR-related and CTD-associated factor 8 isoform X2 [Corythoichthys intestinalis]
MAAGIPPPSVTPVMSSSAGPVNNTTPGTPATPATPANIVQGLPDWASQITNTDTVAAVAQILQSPQGQQLQQLVQSLQMQQQKPQPSLLQALDAGLVVQLQALTAQLTAAATANTLNPLEQRVSSFNKKLLGQFDFRNESERNEESKKETSSSQLPMVSEPINSSLFHQLAEQLQQQNLEQFQKQLLEHQQKALSIEGQDTLFAQEKSVATTQGTSQPQLPEPESKIDDSIDNQQQDMDIDEGPDGMEEDGFEAEDKKTVTTRSRTRSRSRSRSPKRRRSRSRSGSRKRRHRKRSRSRSRDRKRKTSRSYSSERQAQEREKERQKKGLPPIRSKTLSVCSTTLWVGQVDKKASQQDLTNLFEEFGQIESINMIGPRGCAFICMVHRQDAYRARQKLSKGSCKIGSKVIKIAWALNKGVRQEYKQFWDVDLGVSYIPWEKVKLDDLNSFAEGGIIDQETVNEEWETAKKSESTKDVLSQPPSTEATTVNSQSESYNQQVTMMPVQLPVPQAVPGAVGLLPPNFPVNMSIPPPGYGPPPPFLRPTFNASQPPPGFLQATQTAALATAPPSLVQPPVSTSQETVKEAPFSAMIPTTTSMPGGFMSSTIPGANVFNATGVQSQHSTDKMPPSAKGLDGTPELTLQGMHNAVRSGMGLLGMHPTAALAHPLHQPGMAGQRMPGMLPLDVRPNVLPPVAGARFPLLLQQGPTQQAAGLIDGSLQAQAHVRPPFPQLDPFHRPPHQANDNVSKKEESSSGADEGKDQDYRFPPPEKQSTGLLRTPPPEHRALGGGGTGGGRGGGRPPLLQTPGTQPARGSLLGRLQALAGFTPDNQWNQSRGDFDERDGLDRPNPGHSFPNRFDNRPGNAASQNVGGPQPWNRSGGAAKFDSDLDERRSQWDRQRDRDEREFDFRREMNGNRPTRDRDRERGRDRAREHDKDRDKDRELERGNWTPVLPLPTPLLPTPPINPNLNLNQGKLFSPLKMNTPLQSRFRSPLLSQTQAKVPLLGQHPALVQSPDTRKASQTASVEPKRNIASLPETPLSQPPPLAQPDNKVQSPLPSSPTEAWSLPQQETSPLPESVGQASDETARSSDTPSQSSPMGFTQAVSPPEEMRHSQEKKLSPQSDTEMFLQEKVTSPKDQWLNGAEMDKSTEVEPTPDASPEPVELVLPESKVVQEQAAPPQDVDFVQSEAVEEAASEPVLDTDTDTEGT